MPFLSGKWDFIEDDDGVRVGDADDDDVVDEDGNHAGDSDGNRASANDGGAPFDDASIKIEADRVTCVDEECLVRFDDADNALEEFSNTEEVDKESFFLVIIHQNTPYHFVFLMRRGFILIAHAQQQHP